MNQTTPAKLDLKPADYAKVYGVSARTIHRWISLGYPMDCPRMLWLTVSQQKYLPPSFPMDSRTWIDWGVALLKLLREKGLLSEDVE
jgi:hypothetical protein